MAENKIEESVDIKVKSSGAEEALRRMTALLERAAAAEERLAAATKQTTAALEAQAKVYGRGQSYGHHQGGGGGVSSFGGAAMAVGAARMAGVAGAAGAAPAAMSASTAAAAGAAAAAVFASKTKATIEQTPILQKLAAGRGAAASKAAPSADAQAGPNSGPQIGLWERLKRDVAARKEENGGGIFGTVKAAAGAGNAALNRGLEGRYGSAIGGGLKYANAALMATPIPGAHPIGMAGLLAAAEGHRAIKGLFGGKKTAQDQNPYYPPAFSPGGSQGSGEDYSGMGGAGSAAKPGKGISGLVGSLSKLAGPATAVGASILALKVGADTVTKSINAFNDPLLTSSQKMNVFVEGLPLVGGLFKSFKGLKEALDGTTERVAKAMLRLERQILAVNLEAQTRTEKGVVGAEIRKAQSAQGATLGTIQYGAQKTYDKTKVAGDIAQEEGERRQAAADGIVRAQRAVLAAKSEKARQDEVTEREGRQVGRNRASATAAIGAVKGDDTSGKATRTENLVNAEIKLAELSKQQKTYQDELTRSKERGLEVSRAESDARKAGIEASKAEVEILKSKEQRMASAQQRLGAMNAGEYQMAKDAAKLVKEQGLENATPEMIEAANKAAPRMIAKMQENLGEGRARQMQQELGGVAAKDGADDEFQADFKDATLKEVRTKLDSVKADVRIQIDLDEKALADQMTSNLQGFMKELIATLKVRDKTEKERQEIGQRLKRAGEG